MAGNQRSLSSIFGSKLILFGLWVGTLEGVDIASLGLALPRLSAKLGLNAAQGGMCASTGLLGLMIGSTLGARCADLFGRKLIMAISILILGGFSVTTAFADTYPQLLVARFLAGLGIGGLTPILVALAGDAVPPQHRSFAMSLQMASGALGGVLGGLIAMHPDWRMLFYVGGVGPLLAFPLLFVILPDEPLVRSRRRTDERPASLAQTLFASGRWRGTLMLWAMAFCTVLSAYVMVSWLPSLLVKRGYGEHAAHLAGSLFAAGSIFGNLAAGYLLDHDRARLSGLLLYGIAIISAIAMALLDTLGLLWLVAFAMAFGTLGAQLMNIALSSAFYAGPTRTTGLGAMMTAGRFGSVVGPIIVGQLLLQGFAPRYVSLLLCPVLIISLLVTLVFIARRG